MKKFILAWFIVATAMVAVNSGDTAEIARGTEQEEVYGDPMPASPCDEAASPGACGKDVSVRTEVKLKKPYDETPVPAKGSCKRYDLTRDGVVDMKDVQLLLAIITREAECGIVPPLL